MPINKVYENGKLVKKYGKQKYRVRVNYMDNSGKYKQIERITYGADEAKQLEIELHKQVSETQPAKKITVQELYERYMKAVKPENKESTFQKKKDVLERHILPYLSGVKLDKLNIPTLQNWKQEIEKLGISIRMRKNIYSDFRAMLNFAVKMEYIPSNPLLKIGNFKAPLEEHKEMLFYTPEEFKRYISIARNLAYNGSMINWGNYIFFCIAFYSGARKGEINALKWTDVQNGEIKITKSVTQKLKGEDRFTPPKNRSSVRTIQIPISLQTILDEYYEQCQSIAGFNNDYFVCGGIRPLRDTTLENANKKFAELSGVKKIRIHDFRHSHASLLANNGISIQEIARRLGHSDVSVTLKTYSHLYPKETERALKILNEIKI